MGNDAPMLDDLAEPIAQEHIQGNGTENVFNIKEDVEMTDIQPESEQGVKEDVGGEDAGKQDDDIGEIVPDHYSGTVPVFKPTMHQFKDFQRFVRGSPRILAH